MVDGGIVVVVSVWCVVFSQCRYAAVLIATRRIGRSTWLVFVLDQKNERMVVQTKTDVPCHCC
jgi:hypothetical protein